MNTAAGAPSPGRRIAVITTSYPTDPDDPSGHFVRSEVRALRAAGNTVHVIAPRPCSRAALEEAHWLEAGAAFGFPGALARLRRAPLRASSGAVRFVLAARALLARLRPDALVAHFLVPCAWPIATGFGRRAGELEVVAHGSDVRLVARLPRVLRARIARDLGSARVRCVSEELAFELGRALGGRVAERIRVAASPLELPLRPTRREARARLGLAEPCTLAVVVGRLVPQKRVAAALRAARAIPGATAVVVGDGPERSRLEREFPEARFVGHVARNQALTWIAASDVLLSASREEGAPSAIREARALGTPVVAVASGDLEAWSRDDPGLWVVSHPSRGRARWRA
jgi:glycosyltransferase involved in cell wall biosynthesis